jgi:hypothetical protein
MFQIISNNDKGVWFYLNGVAILFIDKSGTTYTKGDVVGFAQIPSLPKEHTIYQMDSLQYTTFDSQKKTKASQASS